jgi:hypothetical protein
MFAADGSPRLERLVKGSIDGVGTRPRLRGEGADGKSLIDRSFEAREIADIPAAMQAAAGWLRESQNLEPAAVGHRVVHGGPGYDRPMLIDDVVLAELERYVPLAPLHQPNNLAPIRAIRARFPELPQVACFDTAFHRGHGAVADHYAIPEPLYAVASAKVALDDTAAVRGKDPLTALNIKALREEIAHYCALGVRVIDQARRRVLEGEQVPTSEKIYSIFEPHTDLIKRGKMRTPVEFGHKVFLAESAARLITSMRFSKATLWTKSTWRPRSGVTAASSAVPRPSMVPIAASSARATSLSARAAASPWSRSRSAAAGKRRNGKLTNDRRPSNKASASVPASRGASRC